MTAKKTLQLSVLLLVHNTLAPGRRSGIQRVAIELASNLPATCTVDFVKWDEQDGQLRFCDIDDLDNLFGIGQWPNGVRVRRTAHRLRTRFSDLLEDTSNTWLLNPEIAYHMPAGNEVLARIISQCREYGVRTAAVFYDLIPITNPAYQTYAPAHAAYVCELFRSDLILPISEHSRRELVAWYGPAMDEAGAPVVETFLLPELQSGRVTVAPSAETRGSIVMVGTVEPRKRQVAFLQAYQTAAAMSPSVAALKVEIFGSLHGDVAVQFRHLVNASPQVEYHDYASEDEIRAAYGRALFSAFVSDDEGYGLPIAESLAHGVPSLCARFGSMAEIADGGGCLAIDVRDSAALRDAIIRLAEDKALRATLQKQIKARKLRSWTDYATAIVDRLNAVGPRATAESPVVQAEAPASVRAVQALTPDAFDALGRADVIGFDSLETRDAFVAEVAKRDFPALLPSRLIVEVDPAVRGAAMQAAARELAAFRGRLHHIRDVERTYAKVKRARFDECQAKPWFLRIVISTYNRSAFVEENVRWLLEKVATPGSGIHLTVLDNASTDDSLQRLVRWVGNPHFQLVRNTTNVGMLGNLRVCSGLTGAEYVWVVGDDDYVMPESVAATVQALRDNVGVPIAFTNFGVYHRFALSPGDSAPLLIAERVPMAPAPDQTGVYSTTRCGSQHDNLFTAIYPIIWRSDVLAACFNYPFTGVPFGDLVECVPSTYIILKSYAAADALWLRDTGIVGNAHNSWSRHRPRWHALLMPWVFELGRDAEMDPELLYNWAIIHGELYEEAIGIAAEQDQKVNLSQEELEVSWRVLRKRLKLPSQSGKQA